MLTSSRKGRPSRHKKKIARQTNTGPAASARHAATRSWVALAILPLRQRKRRDSPFHGERACYTVRGMGAEMRCWWARMLDADEAPARGVGARGEGERAATSAAVRGADAR